MSTSLPITFYDKYRKNIVFKINNNRYYTGALVLMVIYYHNQKT